MEYLIRFVQIHESFRKPEIEALAALANVNVEFLSYSENVRAIAVPFPPILKRDFMSLKRMSNTSPDSILNCPSQRRSGRKSAHRSKYFGQSHLRIVGQREDI